ncbi:helix-turn-helix transcriptional regulator [uncultured Paracoccus sp.]|uniref:helix-turn-helix domain-containing protein n=1 Tax=uncultured Paracoccus sp. TaxID=189685 RepID=UPI0025D1D5EC|nr:helix-turn-helix transcriptional regulator [uncultured Paracoccus sp.]
MCQRGGMTQTQLAKKLNEYQSFVARLESGQRRVDVVELIRLSEVLGFAPDDMVRAVAAVQDS